MKKKKKKKLNNYKTLNSMLFTISKVNMSFPYTVGLYIIDTLSNKETENIEAKS